MPDLSLVTSTLGTATGDCNVCVILEVMVCLLSTRGLYHHFGTLTFELWCAFVMLISLNIDYISYKIMC